MISNHLTSQKVQAYRGVNRSDKVYRVEYDDFAVLSIEATNHEHKRALITGITGQDGSYLAEFLLDKGYYKAQGTLRWTNTFNRGHIEHLHMLAEHSNDDAAGGVLLH